jgi:hypothetical protein
VSSFTHRIRPHVEAELELSAQAQLRGAQTQAFNHLERAHVLGQTSTVLHVRAHWRMLIWSWKQRDIRECLAQLVRIAGAATKTAIGLVPSGNTGGSNISPFRSLPVPPELAEKIQQASARRE